MFYTHPLNLKRFIHKTVAVVLEGLLCIYGVNLITIFYIVEYHARFIHCPWLFILDYIFKGWLSFVPIKHSNNASYQPEKSTPAI